MYKQFQQNNTNKTNIVGNDKTTKYLQIYKIYYYDYNILLSI